MDRFSTLRIAMQLFLLKPESKERVQVENTIIEEWLKSKENNFSL